MVGPDADVLVLVVGVDEVPGLLDSHALGVFPEVLREPDRRILHGEQLPGCCRGARFVFLLVVFRCHLASPSPTTLVGIILYACVAIVFLVCQPSFSTTHIPASRILSRS